MGCQPPFYEGNMDPVVTNRWITETELAFRACNCLDIQKTSFAVLRLKGRALTWWNTLRKTLGAEQCDQFSWNEFVTRMKKQFCADRVMLRLENEFLNIKKGSRTVDEYAMDFADKMVFSMRVVPDELSKVTRFAAGLPKEFQVPVKMTDTLEAAIWAARHVEDMLKMKTEGSGTEQVERKRFDGSSRFGSKKRGFDRNDKKGSTDPQELKWCDKCKRKHTGSCGGLKCFNCGDPTHMRNQCPKPGPTCFKCNEVGHISTNCPNKGNEKTDPSKGNSQQKGKGRAYQMTIETAEEVHDVVSGTFLVHLAPASILFDSGAKFSFISHEFDRMIFLPHDKLNSEVVIETATGELIAIRNILRNVSINLNGVQSCANLLPMNLTGFDVVLGMDWLGANQA